MKRILLILALIFMFILPVFGQTGDYTSNDFFYLPEYGAYGTDEYDEYNAYMEIADNQIKANKDSFDEFTLTDVTDVDLTDIANLKILKYNSTTEKWECEDDGGSGFVSTSGTPVQYDFARFINANTVEGRSYSEVKEDLNLEIGTDVLAEQTIGIADDNLVEIDDADAAADDYCKLTANGIVGRSYSEVKTDLVYQLSDMSDVGSTAPTDTYVLVADGDSWESRALVDGDIPNDITIDLATLATTVTITDNENTAENNPIVFVAGGDLDGGDLGLETDGTAYYTPSTGKITTTTFAGDGGSLTVLGSAYTVDNSLEAGLRNGIYSGLAVTDVSGINISWTSGVAYVDSSIFAVNADASEDIADNATTYLYVLKDNATMQESVTEPVTGVVGEFALVSILKTCCTDIHEKFDFPQMSGSLRYDLWRFLENIIPVATVSGCNVSIDTDATLANDFTVATGTYYIDVFDLNTVASTLYSSTGTHDGNGLTAYYHDTSVWTSAADDGVDFAYWDDGADKDTTAANKWYVGWIFVEDGSKIIYVYPQTEHASEGAALIEGIVYPPYHEGTILPTARFIFRHGVSAFGTTAYFTDIRPFFIEAGGNATAQNIYQTINGDSGTTSAIESDATLSIVGGGIALTAVTTDTVTITATEVDSVVGAIAGIVKADGAGNISVVTTSAELAGVISDETGSGKLVFADTPTLVTPELGVATATSVNFGDTSLDYYKEGTWTPIYKPATGDDFADVTYDFQHGSYVKIGRLVFITCKMRTDAIDKGTATGGAYVNLEGLPSTVRNASAAQFNHPVGIGTAFAGDNVVAVAAVKNTKTLVLKKNLDDDGCDVDDLGTGTNANYISFSLSYITE